MIKVAKCATEGCPEVGVAHEFDDPDVESGSAVLAVVCGSCGAVCVVEEN